MTDLSPLRALPGLRSLHAKASDLVRMTGALTDLWPLRGLRLTGLNVEGNRGLTDLRPLADMTLDFLQISGTSVQDLTPLQKTAQLVHFYCSNCRVYDLSPLKGQPLRHLRCDGTPVNDLTPLRGMPLFWLTFFGTPVKDLTPLHSIKTLKTINHQDAKAFLKAARTTALPLRNPTWLTLASCAISARQSPPRQQGP